MSVATQKIKTCYALALTFPPFVVIFLTHREGRVHNHLVYPPIYGVVIRIRGESRDEK